jgi:uncharacterized membrane protein YeaQ/YmgE (transglycosylase-associated protein family)
MTVPEFLQPPSAFADADAMDASGCCLSSGLERTGKGTPPRPPLMDQSMGNATMWVAPASEHRPTTEESVMGVIAWIVLGAVAGLIAEHLTGKRTGLLLATVIGIVGALLGGFIAKAVFGVQTLNTFFNLSTWVTAIVGAVVLFLLFGAVRGRRGPGRGRGRSRRWGRP